MFRTIKNDWCLVCSWFCYRCKALTLGQLLDTHYVMFRRMKNFLGAVEVKKFSKIQYIQNLRSGLTDTRDFKITFFVCLSFNKKIGGTWSPPRYLVRKIWHPRHVLKATAMRLMFLKNFWVEKNTTEASKRGKIRRNFWVDRSIIFEKTNIFSFYFHKKWLVGRGMLPLPPIESADHLRLKTYA